MRKIFLSMGVVLGVLVLFSFCFAATREASMVVTNKPVIMSIMGSAVDRLGETRFPELVSRIGISDACWNEAKATISNQRMPGNWDGQGEVPVNLYRFINMDNNGQVIIPPRNRRDSKILVSWTLDIMADDLSQQSAVPVTYDSILRPHCSPCSGCSVAQNLPAGNVYVQAFVNGSKQGNQVIYSLTGGISIGNWSIPRRSDPTCSGSFVLDREDFPAREFPGVMTLQLGWYNDSSLRIMAPARRRIINVLIEPAS